MQLLKNRSLIIIEGEQRKDFLQGLITNNIYKCPIYTLMLNAVGKFLYDFFIIDLEDKLLIDCDYESLDKIIIHLERYKLRSKINISSQKDKLGIFSSKNFFHHNICYEDPRNKNLGYRIIMPLKDAIKKCEYDYEFMRLNLGIAEGNKDMIESKSFPLEFGMDRIGAIDFNKGCYIGQEVISRTKYRGTIRKDIFIIKGETLPSRGDDIIVDQTKIGTMCSKLNNIGLALIRLEEYEKLNYLQLNFKLESCVQI